MTGLVAATFNTSITEILTWPVEELLAWHELARDLDQRGD
jgi:hypothetical protein